jgi:serine/threonine protein kinase
LGATIYFLLAGHPPFPDGTVSQKLIAHQTRRPTPIQNLRPEVPPELAAVLDRMMAKSIDDRFQTPSQVFDALLPFVQVPIEMPPDDEMPVLSPAARENTSGGSSPGSASGTFRQDSAVLREAMLQRSGRLTPPPAGGRPASGFYPVPSAVATGPSRGSSSRLQRPGGGSSGNMQPPYFEPPPMISPLGSAAIPPIPNPTRPTNETARMVESNERTETSRQPRNPRYDFGPSPKERKGIHPVLKITLESVAVFAVFLLLWAIFRAVM